MATTHTLKAETRTVTGSGKLNQLRKSGWIPAVVYGAGVDNVNIQVNEREFAKMLANVSTEHFLVDLQIDGNSNLALLQDVQHNSLTGCNEHIDFLLVNDESEIHSIVPIVVVGEAIGATQGGIFDQTLHELHITCKVKDLPESIEVDVTNLQIGSSIRLADITLPTGVTTSIHGDTPIAVVEEASAEEEAPAATEEESVAE